MELSGGHHVSVTLSQGKDRPVPVEQGAGWAAEPIWMF
jgi:hypothetical protein